MQMCKLVSLVAIPTMERWHLTLLLFQQFIKVNNEVVNWERAENMKTDF